MLDLDALSPLLRAALFEDIGPGDVTSGLLVPADARASARIRAKAEGVVAGVEVAAAVFRLAAGGEPLSVEAAVADGAHVRPGDAVLSAEGTARVLLAAERTALNFLIRLSGIATLTSRFVAAVAGTGARILDTRKTTPGLRVLERFAVRMGGGENHRFALYDAVLVKENHLAFKADLAAALARRPPGMPAIVEAENMAEFRAAVAAGADVVMLDEWTPDDVRAARRERGDRPRPLLEISGGINLGNIRGYAEAGAERISIGALTHSAPALDLSMRVSPL
ncbi:MAG TPA: carboxylating nicotinate-nucleotide diphosphorylase [Planctomycetota bacterium]|nr:carboxylating nicotinate-nucleotide diphosphorylase [Planctomycetota bacterium]